MLLVHKYFVFMLVLQEIPLSLIAGAHIQTKVSFCWMPDYFSLMHIIFAVYYFLPRYNMKMGNVWIFAIRFG